MHLDETRTRGFEVTGLDGKPLPLSSLLGARQPVLISFWATWCAPCRKEMPHFAELARRYREQGLIVVGLSIDDSGKDGEKVRDFVAKYKLDFPVAYASQEIYRFFDRGGFIALPRVYIFTADGHLYRRFGRYSWSTNSQIARAADEAVRQK